MKTSMDKLANLLENHCTIDFIKRELNLTNSQLAYRLSLLKNMGYIIQRRYYGNGDITLFLGNEPDCLNNDCAKIYTKFNEDNIRILVISDLHYFHKDENRKAIDNAFNYCKKNGINLIFICGDLIDCMEDNEVPISKQAESFTSIYPHDDSIINFCVLGNHDFMSIKKNYIDFKKIIENKRLDIVPINYLEAKICIKNDKLFLEHPICDMSPIYKGEKSQKLIFIGHSHVTKISGKKVYVPSLSNVKTSNMKKFNFVPQALDTTLRFDSKIGTIKNIIIDQVVMNKVPYIVSEHIVNLYNLKYEKNGLEVDEYPSSEKILIKKQ